ncbi:MAG: aquaporin family protein [Neomegalonema sp.]|nr:aquaporin family protein [Neomegalonema sp.]
MLLAAVVGSGIMAETLIKVPSDTAGSDALALLANTIPTGAMLVVIITIFGPISGAHFNPAVTVAFMLRGELAPKIALLYIVVQIVGGILGVWATHAMFVQEEIFQFSTKVRTGAPQWFAEVVATFGLLITIFGGLRYAASSIPVLVGLYITSAYWFTASTSFANPAVTIARTFSDSFAGIAPGDAPAFIVAQLIGALVALGAAVLLFSEKTES